MPAAAQRVTRACAAAGVALSLTAILLALGALSQTLSDWVRHVGALLQILGLAEVFWSIWGTTRDLNLPTARTRLGAALRRVVGRITGRNETRALAQVARASGIALDGKLGKRLIRGPGTPIEQRLGDIEAALDRIDERFDNVDAALARETTNRNRLESEIRNEMLRAVGEVRGLVERTAGGGLRIKWWAALLVLVGIGLTSWPEGTADILRWLFRIR